MNKQENTHVIIAGGPWDMMGLKHRRHRIAEYLINHKNTYEVIWIYPITNDFKTPIQSMRKLRVLQNENSILENGIKEYPIINSIGGFKQHYEVFQKQTYIRVRELLKSSHENSKRLILWYTVPLCSLLGNILNWDRVIYDCSDLWTANWKSHDNIMSKINKKGVFNSERKIVNRSDLIFTTSSYLCNKITQKYGRDSILIENGVEIENFRRTNNSTSRNVFDTITKPRLVFLGGMKAKIDFNLISKIAKNKKDWNIILIGPKAEENESFNKLLSQKNVHWLGSVDHSLVPHYLNQCDIGLLPFKDIEYNKAVFPLKLFEYLAAGIPVIGCGVPSTHEYVEEGVYLFLNKSDDIIKQCEIVLNWPAKYSRRFVVANLASWKKKLALIYALSMGNTTTK